MKKFAYSVVTILILFALATWAVSNMRSCLMVDMVDSPAISLKKSKERGVFCYELLVDPKEIKVGGAVIQIESAWVEHKCKIEWPWVWFPSWRIVDGYYVVLKINEQSRGCDRLYSLTLAGDKGYLGYTFVGGEMVASEALDSDDYDAFTIIVRDETEARQSDQTIVLTRMQ